MPSMGLTGGGDPHGRAQMQGSTAGSKRSTGPDGAQEPSEHAVEDGRWRDRPQDRPY